MVAGKLALEEFVVTNTSTWAHTVSSNSHFYSLIKIVSNVWIIGK
jgi:hypothetical protein